MDILYHYCQTIYSPLFRFELITLTLDIIDGKKEKIINRTPTEYNNLYQIFWDCEFFG